MNGVATGIDRRDVRIFATPDERMTVASTVYRSVEEFVHDGLPQLVGTNCQIVQIRLADSELSPAVEQLSILLANANQFEVPTPRLNSVGCAPANRNHCANMLRAEEALHAVAKRFLESYSVEEVLTTLNSLSHRELDVLVGLLNGRSCKQVAGELDIGFQTVAKHKGHLLKKLRVRTLTELTTLLWSVILVTSRRMDSSAQNTPANRLPEQNDSSPSVP